MVVVASMVAVVVGSRYSDKIAQFTKVQREDSKSGIQLKVTLIVACYFIVPLLHWIWLYGGLQNQVVLVSLLLDIYPIYVELLKVSRQLFIYFSIIPNIFFVIAKAARGNSTMEFWRIGVYIL